MLNVLLRLNKNRDEVLSLLEGHTVDMPKGGLSLRDMLAEKSYNVVFLDDPLLVPEIKENDPRAEIFLVGAGEMDEVEAVRQGAAACFPEPLDMGRLKKSIDAICDMVTIRRETAELEKQLCDMYSFSGMVGKNPKMLEIFNFLRRIAPYFKTVTVLGETGVGKEVVARALHSVSPWSKEPFLTCNCGALVENLIESELFGHKKGSFTGAITDKQGLFEAAGEGTVFLDEIGDLPLSFQPHLLRVLQNGEFRKVGSSTSLKARCRVIAATNRDLARDVKDGRFREDLYFRLTPIVVQVPPLRERKDDVPLLCRYILNRFCERTKKKIQGISIQAQAALMAYDWPGNVRQLENIIEHIAILTSEGFIKLDDLPAEIRESRQKEPAFTPMTLDAVISQHIRSALKECDGNKTHAARMLGITRRALSRKLEKYGIEE